MRSLASIQKIKSITEIPEKDKIAYISFESVNWSVIGNKNLSVGELVCFVEYDSILPEFPCFEFLRKRCFSQKRNGFVIRPMKMSGFVSYGILFTKNDLKEIIPNDKWNKLKEGDNITEILKIRKMEDETPNEPILFQKKNWLQVLYKKIIYKLFHIKSKKIGGFPNWASRSDETRIEALGRDIFYKYTGKEIYSTIKMDGQSSLFGIYKDIFYICSRNCLIYRKNINKAIKELNVNIFNFVRIKYPSFCISAAKYNLPYKFKSLRKKLGFDFYIQAEQCGPNIQGNKIGLNDLVLYCFNFFNIDKKCYYSWCDIEKICKELDIPTVPFIEIKNWDFHNLTEAKNYAKGKYENGHEREGVVIRAFCDCEKPMPSPDSGMSNMWSFKIINDDFLFEK